MIDHPILTPDIVEKAARAAYLSRYPGGHWAESCLKPAYSADARAVLLAALPEIIERCAKESSDEAETWRNHEHPCAAIAVDTAAARIRSLIPKVQA